MRRRAIAVTEFHRRHPFRALLLPIALATLVGYFGHSAFTGALGIRSMDDIKAETADLSGQLADLQNQRTALETEVARMRPNSLDADLVDSTARAQLSLMRPDEVVLAPAAAQ
jgi:cell division protein FtsB